MTLPLLPKGRTPISTAYKKEPFSLRRAERHMLAYGEAFIEGGYILPPSLARDLIETGQISARMVSDEALACLWGSQEDVWAKALKEELSALEPYHTTLGHARFVPRRKNRAF